LTVTLSAAGLLVKAGLMLRRFEAARNRGRPIASPTGSSALRSLRPSRLRQFEVMAQGVLRDVGSALIEAPCQAPEVRSLLPIVCEVRRHGEVLLRTRGPFGRLLWPAREWRLAPLVRDLARIEDVLRALPRSRLTLEDVLAGRFDVAQPAEVADES
jgi:hypothetical protein